MRRIKVTLILPMLIIGTIIGTVIAEQGYDVGALVAILENSAKVSKTLGHDPIYESISENQEELRNLVEKGEVDKALALLVNSTDPLIQILKKEQISTNITTRGSINRLRYYISVLNSTDYPNIKVLSEMVTKAEENLKAGNIKEAQLYLSNAETILESYEVEIPSVSSPDHLLEILLAKYNSTLKYSVQVGIALNESEYKRIEEEAESVTETLSKAKDLIDQGRDFEALLLLQNGLNDLIEFQDELESLHESVIRRMFNENDKLLILKLSIMLKGYGETNRYTQLLNVASLEITLAKEDLKLGRREVAYLRILHASKILDYIARVEGT
ncbi:hypothetical protein [Pyrococcus abyssi]|uniref:Uncharacterized protein n=1 Tax=Pyrococcus abyssi (strain GE5 / Orsay) TaxID=272844 RepID=Q9V013_PYRAB|nr:hypothetical protein [Pyrococcus abyssi]CAB49893.1 Hypothetical protein PAB0660 [Pyrococcus abyssi GE5]CCE70391.1 TPA: hypothetical protein PAB0660 [Pyrococcus abyssi GE5]